MAKIYQELSEKINEKEKRKKRFLNFIDSCISLFVVSPLVVSFWRGLWSNIEYYDLHYKIFPQYAWLISSYIMCTGYYYTRGYCNNFFNKKQTDENDGSAKVYSFKKAVIYRFYHYILAFSSIMIWRCIWNIPTSLIKGSFCDVNN